MITPVTSQFFDGFLLGIVLFSAPGPKDALVLRQGASGGSLWGVVAICVIADAVLIAIGTAGVGVLLDSHPRVVSAMLLAGAAYLVWFGGQRMLACIRNTSTPNGVDGAPNIHRSLLNTTLMLSFANPYAWLDTIVLIGSTGAATPVAARPSFFIGTMSASCIWFMILATGARKLTGVFKSPKVWRWLDAAIALLMAYLTAGLLRDAIRSF
ncbi:LysE/ArgO family amino acid transporter [Paraburkholderia mimosarum]|uniref:LysE/ArgO family amino acid transporter n=1 Tax=Paraburkholderia mimosarum TaxID=312026 RepID=UPI000489B834|nr:LysE family transporter [Paraburkholderia mimosarum]